jgi:hypothetical protein
VDFVSKRAAKKTTEKPGQRDELRSEYDLSKLKGPVRGKYLKSYREKTSLVLLPPDVALYFPDAEAVNSALRALIRSGKRTHRRSR